MTYAELAEDISKLSSEDKQKEAKVFVPGPPPSEIAIQVTSLQVPQRYQINGSGPVMITK